MFNHPLSDGIRRKIFHLSLIVSAFVLAIILSIKWVDAAEIVQVNPSCFLEVIGWVTFGFIALLILIRWCNNQDDARMAEMKQKQDDEALLRQRRRNMKFPLKSGYVPPVRTPFHSQKKELTIRNSEYADDLIEDEVIHRSSSNASLDN